MIGKTLAQYQIGSSLGAGGMGEVYRARDTRLGRAVAVKLLPDLLAQDPERIARFQREAIVLASLNHPNIAALYGLEEFEGRHFLVMELVEGETLAERIAGGPLAVDETLKTAHQIVEALEAAHEKGIVHRDLKPANVKITSEGKVKVLDFGLAKAMENAPANANLSQSPTLSLAATNAGVILGTAAYMSPEQAKGASADHRSDIFSFGCVLYEMFTGRQPFQGDSLAEVLAGVLAREPDLTALPARLHPRIPELLRRCLEKNPKRRWHAVADIRVEIEAVLEDPRGLRIQEQSGTAKRPLWKRAIPVVAGVILSAAIASLATWNLKPPPPAPITKFPFTLPEGQQFTIPSRQVLSISPDGTQFVYVANNRLYLKPMRELGSIPIQGTESTQAIANPVFSPDGRSLVFFSAADGTLKRIVVSGGAPVTICQAGAPFGISWGADGQIVFGQGARGIMRVFATGGNPEPIVTVKSGEAAHGPQMLPGGDAVLFTLASSGGDWDRANIVVQSLRSGKRKTLVEGGSDARYVPTGHIIYLLNGTLLAAPFDVKRLEVTGGSVPIVEGVRSSTGGTTGTGQFSFSDTGSLVFIPGTPGSTGQSQLAYVDRSGSVKPIGLPPLSYATPRISPDGKQLAFAIEDGKESNVYVYELSGATSMRRLTFGGSNTDPVWAGNDRVAFTSDREGDRAIFWQPANNGVAERLTKPEAGTLHYAESWARSNERFSFLILKGLTDIWIHELRDKKDTVLAAGPSSETNSAFSPDGRWVAYTSADSGTREVYVQPFPITGTKWQITRIGGTHPFWSPSGKELFYDLAGQMYSVNIHTQPSFAASNPVALPITGLVVMGRQRNWDILPDGKQFIGVFAAGLPASGTAPALQIQVVLNWFEELKQRMAAQ